MRSRYSRLAMSQMLRISFASYDFDEDLFEGGSPTHLGKVVDVSAVFDGCSEKMLGGGAVVEFDLGVAGVVFGRLDGGVVEETGVAVEDDVDSVARVAALDLAWRLRRGRGCRD